MAGNMAIVDESPFPFHKKNGEDLQRVFAGIYSDHLSALPFAASFGVDPLKITKPPLSPLDLWQQLLTELARLGKVRAAVEAVRDKLPNNPHVPFLKLLLTEQSAPILFEDETELYDYFGWFDRVDESDELAQALRDYEAPPPLRPIVMGILAEVTDEHPLFIPRLKMEVLSRIYPNAAWPDDYTPWSKKTDITAEWEMRKIARKKLGNDSDKIKLEGLLEKLGPALAGRSTRFEIRVEDFQQPDMRGKLEEFLTLWGGLGPHAPPPVLCVVLVRYRNEDASLAEMQASVQSVFKKVAGPSIAVPPVTLSPCDASNFEGWQAVLKEMGKKIDQKTYDALRKHFSSGPFRLRDLIDRARQPINF
jgi:hypothetical protein